VSGPNGAEIVRTYAAISSYEANVGSVPKYCAIRWSAAASIVGPTSLTTRRCTGVPGCAALTMPRMPPIDVPTHDTRSAPLRAINAVSAVRYTGVT
jgi:hypothetical protein